MHKTAQETHPIIVGVGQITHFEKVDPKTLTALDLMKDAVAACVADTGRSDMLTHLDSISMVNSFSLNGSALVEALCDKIGVRPDIREETAIGGNNPQWLVNRAADLIASGKIGAALLVGGELCYRKKQAEPIFDIESALERIKADPQIVGDRRVGYTFHEELHQAYRARNIYPLFENALRYHLGMSLSEHRAFLRGYFKEMAAVAADTPYAWFQQGKIDAMANPKMCAAPSGAATVETYTVIHDKSVPMGLFPVVVARLDSGERCLATTASDPSVMMAMEQEEFMGKKGVVTPGNNAPNIINF